MDNISETCILVGGYAQPLKGTAVNFAYKTLNIALPH